MTLLNADDIDSCRHRHESSTEWKLRRAFLVAHCDSIGEERLICLASCFVNVECYGCTYPRPVMEELVVLMGAIEETLDEHRNMARDVLTNFVKGSDDQGDKDGPTPAKKGKMSIHFVKATEEPSAVETDEKCDEKSADENESTSTSQASSLIAQTSLPSALSSFATGLSSIRQRSSSCSEPPTKVAKVDTPTVSSAHHEPHLAKLRTLAQHVKSLEYLKKNDIETMHMAASKAKLSLSCTTASLPRGMFQCNVLIDNEIFAKGDATSKRQAKHNAYSNAVKSMKSDSAYVSSNKNERRAGQQRSGRNQSKPKPFMRNRGGYNSVKNVSDFIITHHRSGESTENAVHIMRMSADFNHMSLEYDFRETLTDHSTGFSTVNCVLYLERQSLADVEAATKTDAKTRASEIALEKLRETQWTIITQGREDADDNSSQFSRNELLGDLAKQSDAIPSSNIGNKLLAKMGWSGGGVGKDGTGIAEPVSMASVIDRQGLGLSSEQGIPSDFMDKVRKVLMDYARSDKQTDFVFSASFSNEERALIHKEGQKFGLKTKSYGSGDDRYLVVSRKRTPAQLFEHIMDSGGLTNKYSLIPPKKKSID